MDNFPCPRCGSKASFKADGECECRLSCDERIHGGKPVVTVRGPQASPLRCRHCRRDMIGRGDIAWDVTVSRPDRIPLFSIAVCSVCVAPAANTRAS